MIKKISSVLLCLCLLGMLFVPAFAADDVAAAVDTALSDGTLTVTVQVPAGTDLATLESALQYDADKLELSEVVFGAGDLNTYNAEAAGVVKLYMVWQNSQQDAGTLVTVTFKVKEDAAGVTELSFTDTAATDSADEVLPFSFGDQTISVTLTEVETPSTPNVDEKIPSTAGKYVAAGSAIVVVAAAAIFVSVAVKRKKEEI